VLAAVASSAEKKRPSALVFDTLHLPEIVHSRERPQGTRPQRRTRATTLTSNASTRGDPGLGGSDSGPYLLMRSRRSSDAANPRANYPVSPACSDFRGFRSSLTVYFAAVFIIATAVTELEFLHILAAIVRGDKNYFDFRREFLTRDEALQKTRQDAEVERDELPGKTEALEEPSLKPLRIPSRTALSHGKTMAIAFQLEERAIGWFERTSGVTVQRYVRFRGEAGVVEVDGVAERRRGAADTLLEIKWIRDSRALVLRHMAGRFAEIPRRYKEITKRDAELVLLLVTPDQTTISESLLARVKEHLTSAGVQHRILITPYQALGVTATPDPDDSENTTPQVAS
jgi:hypothetical protein